LINRFVFAIRQQNQAEQYPDKREVSRNKFIRAKMQRREENTV
jgi:hypothetical protein